MTYVRFETIRQRANELVKQNSPDERTLLAKYILELIADLPAEFYLRLKK